MNLRLRSAQCCQILKSKTKEAEAGSWILDYPSVLCTGLNRCIILGSGQVFLFYFLNRVGNGLSIFAPRPGPG